MDNTLSSENELSVCSSNAKNKSILIGTRIPKDYFVASGTGESDITIHAGSYHMALKAAGIEVCNIMTYSSILPAIAREVEKPPVLAHGSVMETIMAVATSEKGTRCTAGIIYGWLYDKQTGKKHGGLVCEHNGNYTEGEIKSLLDASIKELYHNGFSEKYELKDMNLIIDTLVPKKKFGTALVALCFINYVCPIIDKNY
ncbi:MAG: pyruvoyl-dependent arginine decarboxylase [Candidatus Aenigmarchaeota archaeon]|nr:pyruvoyl-dependent arginine decarboxylase [Candidatus Aenigmarchaeota archaeon]